MSLECDGDIDLKSVDSKYRLIFECAFDVILLVDLNGHIIDANYAAIKKYGYTRDELISMKIVDLRAPSERDSAERQYKEAYNKAAIYETIHINKDGGTFHVEVSLRGLIIDGKKVLLAVVRDITKRKEAEKVLSRIVSIVESSDDAIMGMTLDGIITEWNRGAEKMYEYTAKEMLGRSVNILIPEERAGELSHIIEVIKQGGRLELIDTVHVRRDRKPVPVSMSASPIISPKGEIVGISWIESDITERKKYEEALRESERLFRGIYEQAPLGIAMIDSITGKFLHINSKYVKIIGRTEEEMQKTTFMAISHPDELQEDIDNMTELLAGNIKSYNMKKRLFRGDGSVIWVNLTVVPLWEGHEFEYPRVHIAMVEDISEQKRAEETLQRQAELIDLSPDAIMVQGFDGRITFWSHGAELLYGWTKKDAIGQSSHILLLTKFPQPLEQISELLFQKGYWSGELIHTTKDSRQVIVESRWRAQYDKHGNISNVMVSNVDITDRKKTEEALENAKAQAELYLDLMGHDINNMNQIAMGFLEIAIESFHMTDEERKFIEKPVDTLKNSARLIENVRKLQKIKEGSLKYGKIDLCNILIEVKNDYSHIPGRSVTINFMPIPQCYVVANEFIKEVFSNLVGNAIKHTDPQKPLIIDIGLEPKSEHGKYYYKVTVEDNGPGIPDELKDKLFMRFQRGNTKASGKGLGLYLVSTLVSDFHGKIWIEDRVTGDHTKGSKFVVMLPVSK